MTKEELRKKMFDDWLWREYYDKLEAEAIKQVEEEVGVWKSIFGVKQKIENRHNKLFNELLQKLESDEENEEGIDVCPYCGSDLITNVGENYVCNECSERWEFKNEN